MSIFLITRRGAQVIGAALLLSATNASALEPQPLFDSHIHFSVGATSIYTPAAAMEILKSSGIRAALLSSTPNDGTLALYAAYPNRFIPFLRPYRKTRDLATWNEERSTWYKDPQTVPFIEQELTRGIYRGIGEFHVDGNEVDTPVMRELVELAAKHGLWLMAHSDADAIEKLFAFDPKAKILWAHTGMGEPVERVSQLLNRYPRLYGELSYRSGVRRSIRRMARIADAIPRSLCLRIRHLGTITLDRSEITDIRSSKLAVDFASTRCRKHRLPQC